MRIPVLSILASTLLAVPALAQTAEPPPGLGPAAPAAAPAASLSGMSGAGGKAGIGVGGEYSLLGGSGLPAVGGPSVAYEAGLFHIDAAFMVLKLRSGVDPDFGLMGRFWWHLHATSASDFSIGGGIAYRHFGAGTGADGVYIEPGAQLRAFIANNVAIGLTLGLSIGTADASPGFAVTANPFGTAGVHYYFF
jgi:hypothetical protein